MKDKIEALMLAARDFMHDPENWEMYVDLKSSTSASYDGEGGRLRDGRWEYTIRAYWSANAKPPRTPNGLAMETTHANKASRDIEISVYRDRMKRSDISHIDVIEHVEPFRQYRLYATSPEPEKGAEK